MILFSNSFFGGRNTDSEPSKLPNTQYREAHNVEIVGSNAFHSLQNVLGTTHAMNLVDSSSTQVMKILNNKYLISSVLYECLTIFTVTPSDKFKIWCYNTETDVLYELYEEVITASYTTRVVDTINYPENGIDIVYFTDFHNEIRYLKCEIPSPYVANFLSTYDLSLLRKGANGTIAFSSVGATGTLLSGTYQFAYRMADPTNKRFTKWSSLTNPIHVYDKTNSSSPVNSGIGLVTNRKITLSITPSTEETDNFNYIQLAVVENVGPTVSTIDGVSTALPTTASLLEIESIPGTSLTYEYKSNSRVGTIPLEDITVDLAQIEKVKTLSVKDNRLIAGNVHYTDLEFDNGTPSISSGSILRQASTSVDSFSDDNFASQYRGYWRGEVYRFGVVYTDKNGNRSSVSPLNLSSVTGNIISGATDMKFPDRSTSNLYTIFNSDGRIQSLGLRLTGLTNHPTWARSLEIVRVDRKGRFKNILFQTPLVPMAKIEGIGAQSDYPTLYYNGQGEITISDAQPQTSGSTLIPKNLFWPDLRNIISNGSVTGTGYGYRAAGEVLLKRSSSYSFAALFPPSTLYGDSPFVYTGAEKLDVIDYALLRAKWTDYSPSALSSYNIGDFLKTSIVGSFYALKDNQYYFDSTHAKSALTSLDDIAITDYKFFSGETTTVGGNSVMDYESFQTKGITFWQYKPSIQKMGVVQLGTTLSEGLLVFAAGTLNIAPTVGGSTPTIMTSGGATYEDANTITNKYIPEYSSFVKGTSYISALPIVNIKLGLGDSRYGEFTDLHEYISTGTKYTFSTSQIATLQAGGSVSVNLDVWGGDCFVGPQLFKVCDSTYSVVNQGKNNTPSNPEQTYYPPTVSTAKWDSVYRYENNTATEPVISLPVAVENSGQYVQVVVESDYSEVRDVDGLSTDGDEGGLPIYTSSSEAAIRTPLSYKYNLNLSKQNSQKIYVSDPEFSFKQNEFASRLVYSDLKIYSSEQAGFDIFRVSNTYDLEEKYYPITKLALAGDNLYAIQERGIYYVPIGERQVETTDAGTLSIRSGEVIGRPVLVDSDRGCQHIRGVVETGSVIYIPDNRNKNVYLLTGMELKPITKDNETAFRDFFATKVTEPYIISIHDPIRREVWFINNNPSSATHYCHVYNEQLGVWVSDYDFDSSCKGGVYANQNLYLVGSVSEAEVGQYKTSVHTMYTGDPAKFFGYSKGANVTVVINPDMDFSKTFDNVMVSASERLSSIDFVVNRESQQGNQNSSASLNSIAIEGNYRIKTPRDSAGARLRGMYCLATITWTNTKSAIKTIWSKYRLSSRTPF